MQKQKARSKKAGEIKTGDWEVLIKDEIEEFVGYDNLEVEIKLLDIVNYIKRMV